MTSKWKSEAQFQAACVKAYNDLVPQEEWGRLIGIYNNPPNISQLISMGLRPGISDLIYIPELVPIWIELKIAGRKQNPSQERFEKMVIEWGHEYYVVTENLEDFINLINKKRRKL